MTGKRIAKELELFSNQWDQLDALRVVLDHDEIEETMKVLIELGVKAVSLTDRENRQIKMVGGYATEIGEPCTTCGRRQSSYGQEIGVTLAADSRERKGRKLSSEDD